MPRITSAHPPMLAMMIEAAGTLIGAAAASNSYYVAPSYRECRYVERVDRWGNLRVIKVCDVAPY